MRKALNIIRNQKHPARFIFSRLIMKTGLNAYFTIPRNNYALRFHKSALAADLWVNKNTRQDDELLLKQYCGKKDIILDIGANIGSVSLALAPHVKKVFAFEPHPRIFKFFENNIHLNNATNIRPFNMGLGNHDETLYFSDKSDDSQNCIQKNGNTEVSVRTLDSLLEEKIIPQPQIIKVDVEGFETQVLEGAERTCKKVRFLYLECIDQVLKTYNSSEDKLVELIHRYGYEIHQVSGTTLIPYEKNSQNKKMLFCKKP